MRIAIGCDHAGYEHKLGIIDFLHLLGYEVTDFGCNSTESCDYPDFARPTAESVAKGENDFGILICGSGIGMSIVANKIRGIRAANCTSPKMAELARQHNNANVLTFGARLVSLDEAKEIVRSFLNAKFEGGRHQRRVEKIHSGTGC
jgi:ribose 5-phosphate isomerase B